MASQKRSRELSNIKATPSASPRNFQDYIEHLGQLNALFENAMLFVRRKNKETGNSISETEQTEIKRARMLALAQELAILSVDERRFSAALKKKITSLPNELTFALSSVEATNFPPNKPSRPDLAWQVPRLPNGLQWPKETYDKSHEYRTRGGFIRYLERVWRPLIAAGYAERRIVAKLDPSVMRGLKAFEPLHARGKVLPAHLKFLTISEAKALRNAKPVIDRISPKVGS